MMMRNLLRKISDSRITWGVVALILSFGIWVYVTGVNSEETKRTFRGVLVDFAGQDTLREARNLVLTDIDTNTVTVEITGPKRIVNNLSSDDLTAQIDVSRITNSAYTSLSYTILFPDGIDTSNITVNSKTPGTINFMVSAITSKPVQVIGSFDGSIAEGYIGQAPQFEPATITVTGPEAYVKKVSYAYVSFGAENVNSTYSVETFFTLKDSEGNVCDTSTLVMSNDSVIATMVIDEVKTVPLGVSLVYGAGVSEENVRVTIDPESVTLSGDSAILNKLNNITLATIDLREFNDVYIATYPIVIDNGLINQNNVSEANVKVELLGVSIKKFIVPAENISCTNVTNGYTSQVKTESVEVTLRGPQSVIQSIKPENIRVVADLADYNASVGTYQPACDVIVTGEDRVGALGSYTITVELRKAE